MGGVTPTGGGVASRMMVSGSWRRAESHSGVTRGVMVIRLLRGRVGAVEVPMRSSFGRCPHLRIEIWAPDFVGRWSLEFHGELVGRFVGGGFGFGGEVEDEALEDEEFV